MAPNPKKRRIVDRSLVARDSSCPVAPAVMEAHRQLLQMRVELIAHVALDGQHRDRLQVAAQHDQQRLAHAETEHEEEQREQLVAVAALDRTVDDGLDDERDTVLAATPTRAATNMTTIWGVHGLA